MHYPALQRLAVALALVLLASGLGLAPGVPRAYAAGFAENFDGVSAPAHAGTRHQNRCDCADR